MSNFFVLIPQKLARDPKIKPAVKGHYLAMKSYEDQEKKCSWVSNFSIAEDLGVSERSVRRSRAELIKKGWIYEQYSHDLERIVTIFPKENHGTKEQLLDKSVQIFPKENHRTNKQLLDKFVQGPDKRVDKWVDKFVRHSNNSTNSTKKDQKTYAPKKPVVFEPVHSGLAISQNQKVPNLDQDHSDQEDHLPLTDVCDTIHSGLEVSQSSQLTKLEEDHPDQESHSPPNDNFVFKVKGFAESRQENMIKEPAKTTQAYRKENVTHPTQKPQKVCEGNLNHNSVEMQKSWRKKVNGLLSTQFNVRLNKTVLDELGSIYDYEFDMIEKLIRHYKITMKNFMEDPEKNYRNKTNLLIGCLRKQKGYTEAQMWYNDNKIEVEIDRSRQSYKGKVMYRSELIDPVACCPGPHRYELNGRWYIDCEIVSTTKVSVIIFAPDLQKTLSIPKEKFDISRIVREEEPGLFG